MNENIKNRLEIFNPQNEAIITDDIYLFNYKIKKRLK